MAGIYGEPDGMFAEQRGTFSTPRGMFMPEGSSQQDAAVKYGAKNDLPTALNPMTPAIKSPLAPSTIGQPFEYRNKLIGADQSLSPMLYGPSGFSVEKLMGRLGML